MTCYHPLKGWRALQANKSGKHSIIFNFSHETCNPFAKSPYLVVSASVAVLIAPVFGPLGV
jgi:hypothetical protein